MSELARLIEEHGAEIARYERDFNDMGGDGIPVYPFEQLFDISTDPRPVITVGGTYTSSYGRLSEQLQEGVIGEIQPDAYHVQFKEDVFGGTIRISLSAARNSQQFSGILADEMDSLRATVNKNVMGVFGENAFSLADGWDGKPLISDTHPILGDGSAQDNDLDTVPLNESNLETAYALMPQLKNISGVPMGHMIDTLLVHPKKLVMAQKLTGSVLVPSSGDNAINVLNGIKVVVGATLSGPNNWFAMNSRGMRRNLKLYFQEPFRIMLNEASIDSLYIRIPTRVVLSWGYINHNWIVGSKGAS